VYPALAMVRRQCSRYSMSRDSSVATAMSAKSQPIQVETMNRWFDKEASPYAQIQRKRYSVGSSTDQNFKMERDRPATRVKPHLETHADLGWTNQPANWTGERPQTGQAAPNQRPHYGTVPNGPPKSQQWQRPASANSLRPSGNLSSLTISNYTRSLTRPLQRPWQEAGRGPAYHTVAPAAARHCQRASVTAWAGRVDRDQCVGLGGSHGRLKPTWATQTWANTLSDPVAPRPFLQPNIAAGGKRAAGGAGCTGGLLSERDRIGLF
jgi:hypothetical protein